VTGLKAFGTISRRRLVALGLSFVLLAGCGEGGQLGGGGGTGAPVAGSGGTVGDVGGSGGAAGGSPGQTCGSRSPTLRWELTPAVPELSGVVVRKTAGTDGSENLTIADAAGFEFTLNVHVPAPMPFVGGERIDIRTAVLTGWLAYRTIEIRRDGITVFYATEVERPDLPPPLPLEVGDVACPSGMVPGYLNFHRLIARDGDRAITIDVGQQAKVGAFRVYNDLIGRFTRTVADGIDTFWVAVISDS
jgi:hypothetical protein